jgi:F-type H+-transporting ATPase subunit delta
MLASENGCCVEYAEHLNSIKTLIEESPEYIRFLESPAIPLSERVSAIDQAFGTMSEHVTSFVKILCENGRIAHLPDCITEYNELVKISENKAIATVYYVEPLTEEQKSALLSKLCAISGKTVEAVYIEDTSLIGGIKVLIDDKTIDGSIASRLNKAKGVISQ